MSEKEIKKELISIMVLLRPHDSASHARLRTLEEDLAYLRVIAQYVLLDKEAGQRESYELGRSRRGK